MAGVDVQHIPYKTASAEMADPVIANKIEELGNVAYPAMSRAEVEKFMLSEYATWVPLIRSIGVKLD